MLFMGIFVDMETFVTLFRWMKLFCKVQSTIYRRLHVCTKIQFNRFNMQQYLTSLNSHDTKTIPTSYVKMETTAVDKEHFATNQKLVRLPVKKLWLKQWFHALVTLTFIIFVVAQSRHEVPDSP